MIDNDRKLPYLIQSLSLSLGQVRMSQEKQVVQVTAENDILWLKLSDKRPLSYMESNS